MAKGMKTGGRTKGTPNKASVAVAEKLASLKCDPIEGMARIAMAAESDARDQLQAIVDKFLECDGDDAVADAIQHALKSGVSQRREHLALAGSMYKELAEYIAPKRQRVELSGDGHDGALVVQLVRYGNGQAS